MPEFRGVEYADHTPDQGGINIQLAPDATRVERAIQVAWADLYKTYAAWFGYGYVSDIPGGKVIRRVLPHAIALPGQRAFMTALAASLGLSELDTDLAPEWLYCTGVTRTEGIGPRGVDAEGLPRYDMARITFSYTAPQFAMLENNDTNIVGLVAPYVGQPDEGRLNRYIRKLYKPTQRAVTIPRALPKWVLEIGDELPKKVGADSWATNAGAAGTHAGVVPGLSILESLAKAEQGIDLVYIHMQRPDLPMNQILATIGRVNSVTFETAFPPESLFCEAPEITPEVTVLGQRVYNIAFKFKYLAKTRLKPSVLAVGHNHFLHHFKREANKFTLDYRRVTSTGSYNAADPSTDDQNVFQAADFYRLFRPE